MTDEAQKGDTMTRDDSMTIEAMLHCGGGFVRALARAAQLADADNLARIKAAWPEYWSQYTEMSQWDTEYGARLLNDSLGVDND